MPARNWVISLLGFHGIEYILFEDGSPKSVSKISDLHLTYAVAVAGDLRNRCWQLELSWRGEVLSMPTVSLSRK